MTTALPFLNYGPLLFQVRGSVFNALLALITGSLIRRAFPHFYLFAFGTSAAAAAVVAFHNDWTSTILSEPSHGDCFIKC